MPPGFHYKCYFFLCFVQGIPYAIAPAGKFRWHEPVPFFDDASDCPSELDAHRYGSKCVQLDSSSVPTGSEDCLFLNVWTPDDIDVIKTSRLDVVVQFHDGGLMTGSGHEPCKLTDQRLNFVPAANLFGVILR